MVTMGSTNQRPLTDRVGRVTKGASQPRHNFCRTYLAEAYEIALNRALREVPGGVGTGHGLLPRRRRDRAVRTDVLPARPDLLVSAAPFVVGDPPPRSAPKLDRCSYQADVALRRKTTVHALLSPSSRRDLVWRVLSTRRRWLRVPSPPSGSMANGGRPRG